MRRSNWFKTVGSADYEGTLVSQIPNRCEYDPLCRSISVEEYPDTIFDLMASTEDATSQRACSWTNLLQIYQ